MEMDFFGINIGVTSARLVQLEKNKKGLNLVHVGSIDLPQNGIQADTKKQLESVAGLVKKLISDVGTNSKNVVFSLPEEKVTTRLKWLPPMKEKEISSALKYEAETFIPHPLNKVQLDYQVLDEDDEGRLMVFIVGILGKEIEKYMKIAELLGLDILALEPESVSLNRVLSVENLSKIIVDIKHNYTSLVTTENQQIFLTRTVPIGIKSFSRALKINLGLKDKEAEAYRRTYGLKGDELEGKVKEAMLPIVEKLIREIKQSALSFQKDWDKNVDLISLSGTGGNTPRLTEIIARSLGVEVQVADPFNKINLSETLKAKLKQKAARYSIACGLAARDLI